MVLTDNLNGETLFMLTEEHQVVDKGVAWTRCRRHYNCHERLYEMVSADKSGTMPSLNAIRRFSVLNCTDTEIDGKT